MDEYKGGFDDFKKEICKNCKFCIKLKLNSRVIERDSNKIDISTNKDMYQDSFCCIALHANDIEEPFYETDMNDHCEKFERKIIYDIDRTSIIDNHMIECEITPSRDAYVEMSKRFYEARKKLKEMNKEEYYSTFNIF